jgi:hypothetical protein
MTDTPRPAGAGKGRPARGLRGDAERLHRRPAVFQPGAAGDASEVGRTSRRGAVRLRAAFPVALVALAALALMGAAIAGASTTADSEQIYGCVDSRGTLRVVDDGECNRRETLITWAVQGPEGPVGSAGPEGPEGPVGPAGVTGEAGADGRSLLHGSGPPDAAIGAMGDFYLGTETMELWGPKMSPGWPAAGVGLTGPSGSDGRDGRSILHGSGAPEAELGDDGDFYLDVDDTVLWGPRSDGSWPEPGSTLVGAQGPVGPQGPKGDLTYERTVLVSPTGTPAANGAALLAAMAGITDATSTRQVLLKVEPGIYDLGTERLLIKNWVDVEGSGELVTLVRSDALASGSVATITIPSHTELRSLTVVQDGGHIPMAVHVEVGGRVRDLTARTSGGSFAAMALRADGAARIDRVSAQAIATDASVYGIILYGAGSELRNVTAYAQASGSSNSAGITVQQGGHELDGVRAEASGGASAFGLLSMTTGIPTLRLRNVSLRASEAATTNIALRLLDHRLEATNLSASADGNDAVGMTIGHPSGPGALANVHASQISATTAVRNLSSSNTARFGASQLTGAISGSNLTCVHSYDGSFVARTASCGL